MHDGRLHGQRISNDATILQAELFAIRAALHCALRCAKNTVYILTDSLPALHTLQQQYHQDNIQLITSTLFKLQQLSEQGKSVTLMWIPSHVGIQHNELVDTAAKNSLRQQSITHVKPSLSTIKSLARSAAYYMTRIQHQVWVQAGSPSAFWYKTSTEYESITIPRSMSGEDAVIIHRLRLGYRCSWEIDERNPKQCNHFQSITDKPLIHYLLECDALTAIRPPDFANIQNIPPEPLETADANCAWLILEN